MAAKAKAKPSSAKPKKPSAPKASKGGSFKISWKLILSLIVVFAFGLEVCFSFVPCDYVPAPLKGLHNQVLIVRNTVIARSGLPISRYDDEAAIPVNGAPPVKILFAPSPKISKELDKFIGSAGRTLSVCAYEIDLPDVADALLDAKKRGVSVRVVTDSDNFNKPEIQELLRAGIPVQQDRKPSIMHNKFIVADGYKVWTGSYNFTKNCSFKNDNNALVVDSAGLAAAYQAKFDEYWKGLFSQDAPRSGVRGDSDSGGLPMTALFSPSDGVRARLLDELASARSCVDVMAFSFTSKELADSLARLAANGVKVRCLFDGSQAENKASKDEFLRQAGVKVRISANHSGRMHHKVIVIDHDTVITGSYNFSNNAEMHNDENVLIIRSPMAASIYEQEFQRCWDGVKGY